MRAEAGLFETSNNILQTFDARSLALCQSTSSLHECVKCLLAKMTYLGKMPTDSDDEQVDKKSVPVLHGGGKVSSVCPLPEMPPAAPLPPGHDTFGG